jgi:hypothetical protein
MTRLIPALIAAAALALTATASADVVERRHETDHDYYSFDDDLVSSDVFDFTTPKLIVRTTFRGPNLIRPRVSFVTEVQKSAESL